MEKHTKNYPLKLVRELIDKGSVKQSYHNAILPGQSMGFSQTEIVEVVYNLTNEEFKKSMTQYDNKNSWQDVYYTSSKSISIYLKFKTVKNKTLLVITSFKKNDDR
mgnify:CR=1 FL=1